MAIHCQLLLTTILYVLVAVNSILEISTLSYSKSKAGSCYFYIKDADTEPSLLPCSSNIYINGGTMAYAVIMAIYHGYGTLVASRDNHIGRTMWVMPWLLLNALSMIAIFVCACIYSVGIYITCSNDSKVSRATESCHMKNTIFRSMFIAEISSWVNVFLWCCLIAIEAIRLQRNRRAIAREIYEESNNSDAVKIGDVLPTA